MAEITSKVGTALFARPVITRKPKTSIPSPSKARYIASENMTLWKAHGALYPLGGQIGVCYTVLKWVRII